MTILTNFKDGQGRQDRQDIHDGHSDHLRDLWRSHLDRMPRPTDDRGARLLRVARDFLDSGWCEEAVALGWSEIELWGAHAAVPRERHDAQDLVPAMAFTAFPCHLAGLSADAASIETGPGNFLTHQRSKDRFADAVPIWQCPGLIGEGP